MSALSGHLLDFVFLWPYSVESTPCTRLTWLHFGWERTRWALRCRGCYDRKKHKISTFFHEVQYKKKNFNKMVLWRIPLQAHSTRIYFKLEFYAKIIHQIPGFRCQNDAKNSSELVLRGKSFFVSCWPQAHWSTKKLRFDLIRLKITHLSVSLCLLIRSAEKAEVKIFRLLLFSLNTCKILHVTYLL